MAAALWTWSAEGDLAEEHPGAILTDFATNALLYLNLPRIFQIDKTPSGIAAVAEMVHEKHLGGSSGASNSSIVAVPRGASGAAGLG